jgi:hypothetical protein
MKNTKSLLGLLALLSAIIVLVLTGCPDPNGGGGDPDPTPKLGPQNQTIPGSQARCRAFVDPSKWF